MLHSEILPEQDCGGELFDLPGADACSLRSVCSLRDRIYLHARLRLGHCCVSGDADALTGSILLEKSVIEAAGKILSPQHAKNSKILSLREKMLESVVAA